MSGWDKENGQTDYCRQRTKHRLNQIFPALIILFIAVACGVSFLVNLRSDKTGWKYTDYFSMAVSAFIAAAGLIIGGYDFYTHIRDAFFPAKSRLAKSIRSQLPAQAADWSTEQLFALVDRDIYEHGIWFGGERAAVGQEWILSDDAVSIPRIRVACGRDEIMTRRFSGGARLSRMVAFYLLDDRKQAHSTVLHNPDELKAFMDCLKLRAPDVLYCSYQEYLSCRAGSDIEWDEVLCGFRHRKNERELRALEAERAESSGVQNGADDSEDGAGTDFDNSGASWILPNLAGKAAQQTMPPCLVLTAASGARQHHEDFTREDVEAVAEGLIDGSYRNVEIHTRTYCWMVIEAENRKDGQAEEHFRVGVTRPDADKLRYFSAECSGRQAAMWLLDFYDDRLNTGSLQWRDDTKRMEKKVRRELKKR